MHYNLMHWQVGCSDGSVLLFDIATLGEEAFSSGGLRMLIEDPAVIKLMYVRTQAGYIYVLNFFVRTL